VQLVAKEGDYASVKMPSGRSGRSTPTAWRTIGQVGNVDHENVSIGKAGRNSLEGQEAARPGVAMNPVDHPLGGGEGKTSAGAIRCRRGASRPRATRRGNRKVTDRFIVTRRPK
jgi:large subunit ribosomal protein L2